MDADYNIEFAHVEFTRGCTFNEQTTYHSSTIAKMLIGKLAERGSSYSTSVLIDNKHVPNSLNVDCISRFFRITCSQLKVNYVCYETSLSRYMDRVIHLLPAKPRKKVSDDVEHYLRIRGRIACSHDISIWHLMRLGYINDLDLDVIIPFDRFWEESSWPPFKSKIAVSILSDELVEEEERSQKDILRHVIIPGLPEPGLPDKIGRIYFNDKGDITSYTPFLKEILYG